METKHVATNEAEGRSNNEEEDTPSNTIIMQGWLEKQSNHLKKWRKRWCIIIQRDEQYFIETYRKITILDNTSNNPATAIINIDQNLCIKSQEYQNDNSSGFIINILFTKLKFEFKVYNIYNHTILDWINCINRIKNRVFPNIQTNDMIVNRINNNQSLKSKYIYSSNNNSSSKCIIYDHWKYIFLHFHRIYLNPPKSNYIKNKQENDGKLIKLIISYTNFENIDNDTIECFKWIRNLSILQNIESQRYYTPTIVYDTFSEHSGAEQAGYHILDNLFVTNAEYFPFNKTNYEYTSKYFSIFRCGANNICDLIMINSSELNVKNNFNDQDIELFYHQLPLNLTSEFNVLSPSILYHNNHLFAVGGYNKFDEQYGILNEREGLNNIFGLDLTEINNEWQCLTKKTKLKRGKFGATLTFLTGNQLMVISGCARDNNLSKTVELYEFEGNEYILNENDKENKNIKNKTMMLNDTKCTHFNAGVVNGICYNFNKICIGSCNNIEIFDGYKNEWILQKNTNKIHNEPKLWTDPINENIVYIASQNGVEWMDFRDKTKWKIIENKNGQNHNHRFDLVHGNNVQIV